MGHVVGFISAPDWLDPAPSEFCTLTHNVIPVQQTFLSQANFSYSIDAITRSEPHITLAACQLASAGCTVIASPATPFGFVGYSTITESRAQMFRVQDACGVECVSSITAMFDLLEHWQVNRVALACTYYPNEWRDLWSAFVTRSGLEVLACKSLIDQGIKDPVVSDPTEYPTSEDTIEAVFQIAEENPTADAIVVSGSGARTLAITEELRRVAGRRVLAADTALFQRLCKSLKLETPFEL